MTSNEFLSLWNDGTERLLVRTSGSTGQPKPLWVEKRRMEASARITCDFLGLQRGETALLCLPLDYIAGQMMVVRSLVRGLRLIEVKPGGHPLSDEQWAGMAPAVIDFAAMVPLQVYNSLQVPAECERLRQVRHLLIGGGAVDDRLAEALRAFPHAVWSTYGMTETLSHIALRRLSGPEASDWYEPFPSVSLSQDADGCLIVDAPLVCPERLVTNDIVELSHGRMKIIGRRDNTICSGGIKIQAEEVERRLRGHLEIPFLITKAPDAKFGEVVVLLLEGGNEADARQLCQRVLPRFWQPRIVRTVPQILFTRTGKPRRDISLYGLGKTTG